MQLMEIKPSLLEIGSGKSELLELKVDSLFDSLPLRPPRHLAYSQWVPLPSLQLIQEASLLPDTFSLWFVGEVPTII